MNNVLSFPVEGANELLRQQEDSCDLWHQTQAHSMFIPSLHPHIWNADIFWSRKAGVHWHDPLCVLSIGNLWDNWTQTAPHGCVFFLPINFKHSEEHCLNLDPNIHYTTVKPWYWSPTFYLHLRRLNYLLLRCRLIPAWIKLQTSFKWLKHFSPENKPIPNLSFPKDELKPTMPSQISLLFFVMYTSRY